MLASALGPLCPSKKSKFLPVINNNIIVDVFQIEKMTAKKTKLTLSMTKLQKSAVPIWPINLWGLTLPDGVFVSCRDLKIFIKNFVV